MLEEIDNIRKWFGTARTGETDKQMGNIANILQAIKNYKVGPLVDGGDNIHMYKQMSRTQHS